MMNNYERSTKFYHFIFICVGIASGFICGFLGTGGGILTVFALNKLIPRYAEKKVCVSQDLSRDCFAMTVATILPASAVSAFIYSKSGMMSFGEVMSSGFVFLLIPAALGGIAGAVILDKIKTQFLKKLFGALIIFGGAMMIFR